LGLVLGPFLSVRPLRDFASESPGPTTRQRNRRRTMARIAKEYQAQASELSESAEIWLVRDISSNWSDDSRQAQITYTKAAIRTTPAVRMSDISAMPQHRFPPSRSVEETAPSPVDVVDRKRLVADRERLDRARRHLRFRTNAHDTIRFGGHDSRYVEDRPTRACSRRGALRTSDTFVEAGGVEIAFSGGLTSNTVVLSGGVQVLDPGGFQLFRGGARTPRLGQASRSPH
jgi:autotransporter passenger strand-loop-strand repeat protein